MTIKLPVTVRDETITAGQLRAKGQVPAVLYGPKVKPMALAIEAKQLQKVIKEAGEATVIELQGLSESTEVLVKEVSFDPVRQQLRHVDFYVMEKGKAMHTHVPLHFVGVSPIEVSGVGTITKVLHEVEVLCKPADLPSHFDVDLTMLKEVGAKVHVSDLAVSAKVTIETEPEAVVAVVAESRAHQAEESAELDMSSVEVDKKIKAETASV